MALSKKDIRRLVNLALKKYSKIHPCVGMRWGKCFILDEGIKEFFFNDADGDTHLVILGVKYEKTNYNRVI